VSRQYRGTWWTPGAVALGVLLVAACGPAPEAVGIDEPAPIQIGGENVVRADHGEILVGPIVSGELRAQRQTTVRAELGGAVLEAPLEEGQTVRVGDLVARLDTRTLDETVRSAQSAVRSAEAQLMAAQAQLEVGQRELERTGELVESGALAERDLDVVRQNATAALAQVTAAEAQVADARARLVSAERQIADAVLRAPIAGVVAERLVSVGDVVSPGTAVLTIVDPSTMELEASLPAERIADLEVGTPVRFQLRGAAGDFEGRIARISPQVDPSTRLAAIFVSIPNIDMRLVSGLFAEGRVVLASAQGTVVPAGAVNAVGDGAWALRVRDGVTERVPVTLGLRDLQTERLQVAAGLEPGDLVLRGAAQGIAPGTAVSLDVVAP